MPLSPLTAAGIISAGVTADIGRDRIPPALVEQAQQVAREGGLQTTDPEADRKAWAAQNGGILPSDEYKEILREQRRNVVTDYFSPSAQIVSTGSETSSTLVVDNPNAAVKIAGDKLTVTDNTGAYDYDISKLTELSLYLPRFPTTEIDLRDFQRGAGLPSNRFVVNAQHGAADFYLSNDSKNVSLVVNAPERVNLVAPPDAVEHLTLQRNEFGDMVLKNPDSNVGLSVRDEHASATVVARTVVNGRPIDVPNALGNCEFDTAVAERLNKYFPIMAQEARDAAARAEAAAQSQGPAR